VEGKKHQFKGENAMPSSVKMKDLLETGVHFGHRTTKWNPKMSEFIFTSRNGIHIIDLQQTIGYLNQYFDMVRDLVANGGTVLFVGTKRQAQETMAREAGRCRMPYVNQRWLPGTLTNWTTIKSSIETMKKLEKQKASNEWTKLTKKEVMLAERRLAKLELRLGGLRDMRNLPALLIVVDTDREDTSVAEANTKNIPVLGIVDTNSNPDVIDYIIPANDDAMRSIRLLVSAMADAVIEGYNMRKDKGDNPIEDDDVAAFTSRFTEYDDDASDEQLLGPAALRKVRDFKLLDEKE
jgi:small subunit ribosomal protein S2